MVEALPPYVILGPSPFLQHTVPMAELAPLTGGIHLAMTSAGCNGPWPAPAFAA